jgi:hypothetical protein
MTIASISNALTSSIAVGVGQIAAQTISSNSSSAAKTATPTPAVVVNVSNAASTLSKSTTGLSLAAAEAAYQKDPTTPVTITDSVANLFNADGSGPRFSATDLPISAIKSIYLTGSNPVVNLTLKSAISAKPILSLIATKYTAAIDPTVADALAATPPTPNAQLSLDITDSADQISQNLAALEKMAKAGSIHSIVTNPSSDPVQLTDAQFTANPDLVKLLPNMSITNAPAASASKYLSNIQVTDIKFADTSANINNAMNSLTAALATTASPPTITINVTDPAPIKMTPAQLHALSSATFDPPAAATISGAKCSDLATVESTSVNGLTVSDIAINDTATNIASNLANLTADNSISTISVSDGKSLAISKSQLVANLDTINQIAGPFSVLLTDAQSIDDFTGLPKLPPNGTLSAQITDTVDNISAAIDQLETLAKNKSITKININSPDNPPATLSIDASQYKTDGDALRILASTGPYKININNSSIANLSSNLRIPLANKISITDTASAISNSFSSILVAAKLGHLGSLNASDNNPVTLTESQFESVVAGHINLASSSSPLHITVAGRSAAQTPPVDPVALLNQGIVVDSVTISDKAANITPQLLAATNTPPVSSFQITNNTPLSMTDAQLQLINPQVLKTINTPYTISVTDPLSASQIAALPSLPSGGHYSVALNDTLDNLVANSTMLGPMLANRSIRSVALSAPSSTPSPLTPQAYDQALPILTKLPQNTSWNVAIEPASAQYAASVGSSPHVASIAVVDTSDNIASQITSLNSLYRAGKLSSTTITAGLPLSMTAAQFESANTSSTGTSFLQSLITSTQSPPLEFNISNASVADLSALNAPEGSSFNSIIVSDTASNISKGFTSIEANPDVTSVSVTDNAPVTIPSSELTTDRLPALVTMLNRISTPYNINLSGQLPITNLSLLSQLPTGAKIGPVSVVGKASEFTANLSALKAAADSSQISSISLSDNPPNPTISISSAVYKANQSVFQLLRSRYSLALSSVAASDVKALAANGRVTSLSLSDASKNLVSFKTDISNSLAAGKLIGPTIVNDTTRPDPTALTQDNINWLKSLPGYQGLF